MFLCLYVQLAAFFHLLLKKQDEVDRIRLPHVCSSFGADRLCEDGNNRCFWCWCHAVEAWNGIWIQQQINKQKQQRQSSELSDQKQACVSWDGMRENNQIHPNRESKNQRVSKHHQTEQDHFLFYCEDANWEHVCFKSHSCRKTTQVILVSCCGLSEVMKKYGHKLVFTIIDLIFKNPKSVL